MDMTRHLRRPSRMLTSSTLAARGDQYKGQIVDVFEREVFPPSRAQRDTPAAQMDAKAKGDRQPEIVPVVLFADGMELIPNFGQRRVLVDALGADTDLWRGRTVVVTQTWRPGTRKDGTPVSLPTKAIVVPSAVATSPAPVAPAPREWSDFDDSPECLSAHDVDLAALGEEIFRGRPQRALCITHRRWASAVSTHAQEEEDGMGATKRGSLAGRLDPVCTSDDTARKDWFGSVLAEARDAAETAYYRTGMTRSREAYERVCPRQPGERAGQYTQRLSAFMKTINSAMVDLCERINEELSIVDAATPVIPPAPTRSLGTNRA